MVGSCHNFSRPNILCPNIYVQKTHVQIFYVKKTHVIIFPVKISPSKSGFGQIWSRPTTVNRWGWGGICGYLLESSKNFFADIGDDHDCGDGDVS